MDSPITSVRLPASATRVAWCPATNIIAAAQSDVKNGVAQIAMVDPSCADEYFKLEMPMQGVWVYMCTFYFQTLSQSNASSIAQPATFASAPADHSLHVVQAAWTT